MKTTTCIVGYNDREAGILYIGGDSAGVSGLDVRIRKDEKVFQNGNMIFGFTSSFRMGQLLRYKLKIPKQKSSKSDYEYLVTDFIDAVKKCLKKNGYTKVENNQETGGTFIIGYKDNLYTVENDFQVACDETDYIATGCGEDYALGVIYALQGWKICAKVKVQRALKCASYFSGGVSEPFKIVSLAYKENK